MNPLKQRAYGLLRKTEKYTKTDMVYVASGGFWLTSAQVMANLLSLPLSAAFAHFLTQNEYGLYRYALSLAAIVSIFSLTGLSTSITRSVAQGKEGALNQGFWLNIRWSIGLVLVSLAGAGYYAINENYLLAGAMVIVAVCSPLFNSSVFFGAFLNGKQDFKRASLYNTIRNIFATGLLLLSLVFFAHPLIVLAVYFLSYTLSGLFFHWLILRRHSVNKVRDPDLPNFSKHVSLSNGFGAFTDQLDKILVFQNIGAAQLAIYSFAEMVPDAINRLTKNIVALAVPKYAGRSDTTGLIAKSVIISLAMLPFVLAYVFAAPYIFALFFPKYMSAVVYSQVLAFLPLITTSLAVAYIDGNRALKEKYTSSIVGNCVKIICLVGGMFLWGVWGIIAGRYAGKLFAAILTFTLAFRHDKHYKEIQS